MSAGEGGGREQLVPPHDRVLVDAAVYRDGHRERRPVELGEVLERCTAPGALGWVGLHDPDARELQDVADAFRLDAGPLREALRPHGRPTLGDLDGVLLVVLRTARLSKAGDVELGELQLLRGPSWVVTVRHGPASSLAEVRRAVERLPDVLRRGPQAVVDACVDHVVADLAPVVAALEDEVDALEDDVFDGSPEASRRVYAVAGRVVRFQRGVRPLVGLVVDLEPRAREVGETEHRFLREVAARARRTEDRAGEARALVQNALSVNLTLETKALSEAANRTGEEVKRITSWAAIFFAPTLVGTIYGMNFEHMPELGWQLGYPSALALMVVTATGLWVAFRRRGWL